MAPSPELTILAALLTLLACDVETHAVATPQATPMLAAATTKPTPAERKAKRAAKQAKADKAAAAKKTPTRPPADTTTHDATTPRPTGDPTAHAPTTPRPTTKRSSATTTPAATALPPCPPDNALTYRSFGDGFLRTWCTGCHSSTLASADRQDAPEGVDFDRAALYKPHARDIYDRAVLEAHAATTDPGAASPMPPAGVVPEHDRRRLGQWIACGSPGA